MSRLRHLAVLALGVLLICATGAVAVALTVQATDNAERIHLDDRQSLQSTLANLGKQYVLFSLKEGLDYASTGTWDLRAGDAADHARLESFVSHAVLLNYGAAVVDLGGTPLTEYSVGPGLPPPSDPGYKPMVVDMLAGRPDVSSVMTVGGVHVVAMGVPITVGDQRRAVFVGYVRLDTSPLETYVRRLHSGRTGGSFVLDSSGTVVAATDPAEVGRHFSDGHAPADIARGATADYVDDRTHTVVADAPLGVGGWGGVTVQSVGEFYGPLRSGSLHVELAIVALLVVAAMLVLVFNHKREAARRRFQAELAYQAAHDSLTGLYNHAVLHERLAQAMSRAKRQGTDVAALYLDLDDFKPINDLLGHGAGDLVLVEIARRIRAVTRTSDTVARMGGDEFAVVMEDVGAIADTEALARRILEALHGPLPVHPAMRVGVSIGVAYSRCGAGLSEDLLRDADLAMYRAKDAGGDRVEWAPVLEVVGG